jgi:hypothetical protein
LEGGRCAERFRDQPRLAAEAKVPTVARYERTAEIGRDFQRQTSTTMIGRFYNGRDHSTVCHAIKRIQVLRDSNAKIEGLLSSLIQEPTTDKEPEVDPPSAMAKAGTFRARDMIWTNEMLDDLAERIASRLRSRNCG